LIPIQSFDLVEQRLIIVHLDFQAPDIVAYSEAFAR
jgi:hypothetical protein